MTELNARVALENKALALLTFFEPFNEFDQEEKYSILFGLTDPNDRKTFSELMVKEFFFDDFYKKIPIETKRILLSVLVDFLRDPNFNFQWLLEEASGTFGLPSAWSIKNHRQLFEEIYRQAYGIWKNDLDAVRFVVPALNELGIDTGDWEK